jgi:SAM-dependent methyltransferase
MSTEAELDRIRAAHVRYDRDAAQRRRRDPGNPGLMMLMGEWHDAILEEVGRRGLLSRSTRVIDVGCGDGWLLERFAAAGVEPESLHGIELIGDRAAAARARVVGARVVEGSAGDLPHGDGSFDVVCLGMVLSSIGSAPLRRRVADECRRVVADDGLIACYELRWTHPANADVSGLSAADVAALFGGMAHTTRSLSLLPPLARRLGRSARWLYRPLSRVPALQARHLTFLSPAPHAC